MGKLKKENLIEGWRIVVKYLKPHKGAIFILSLLGLFSALSNAAIPYIAGRIVDTIKLPAVFYFIGFWVVIRVIGSAVEARFSLLSGRLEGELESEYLTFGHGKLLELPMSFHKTNKMGDVFNRISRASSWLTNLVGNVLITLAPQFLSIIFSLGFAFYINAYLALALVAGVLIYFVILIQTAPRIAEISQDMHKAYNIAFGDAYDSVLNVQAVKQASAEKYEQKKLYTNFNVKAYRLYYDMQKFSNVLNISQKALVIIVQLAIFILSVIFIQKEQMTIGQLVMFNGYAAMFFGPFVILGNNWRLIQNGTVALERAEKVLAQPSEKYLPAKKIPLKEISGEVEFNNASFFYAKKQGNILNDISFHVGAGEKIALVGESGVGKSTLLDLVSGYFFAQKGKVLIDGINIKNLDLKFLRSGIAVVPQEIILFNDTVKNNIKYGSFGASDARVEEAARLAHADEFINVFPKKYSQFVGERGIKLSMGQKQRIALARAFLRNPKILILDEPTSALDAKSERFIQDSLARLMRGRTTFIIAHRLSTVRDVDRIFVLHDGRIAEENKHDELMRIPNGIYRNLYELQVGLV